MEHPSVYIPPDRRSALALRQPLPDRTTGAALFADISGFTPLTETLSLLYGPQRGSEETAHYLNHVYDDLIVPIEQYGGSVIGFSGDAMTCWFDQDDGRRALASAFEIQTAMKDFAALAISPQHSVALSVKVAVVTGAVRRFLIGDPAIRLMDVIAGATMDRLADSEHHANKGDIVIDEATARGLGDQIRIGEWRGDNGHRFALVSEINRTNIPPMPGANDSIELSDDQVRPWLIPALYERMRHGQGEFVAELRSAVPVFASFSGIDYDNDAMAGAKLNAYICWAQKVFARYDGTLFELTIGDKGSYIYGAFGAPIAHDDDVMRAVAAAQDLRRPPADLGFISNIQIGISRGRMRAGPYGGTTRRSYSVIGDETNLAARLMQKAAPGEIMVSGHVAEAIAHRYQIEEECELEIKGKAKPINAYKLLDIRTATGVAPMRQSAAIVGRNAERAALQEQLERLVNEHRGGTIIIEGDAGIGKSRLVEELVAQTRNAGATCAVGAGDAIEQAVLYFAWKPIFNQLLGLANLPDDINTRRDYFLNWLKNAGNDFLDYAPLFSALAPFDIPDNDTTSILSGQVRAETTRDFLARLIAYQMQSTPLVLIIEDAHWLDSSSWALAQRIAALSESLMLVLVSRPLGERPPQEFQNIVGAPTTRRFALGPLDANDAIELVKQRLGVRELPESVAALIRDKAEGNPFFSEEMAYALRDAKLIVLRDGVCELAPGAPDLNQMNFPDKVEDVIISRIDLLAPPQQLALKVASVIGRMFAYRTLSEIHPVAEDIPHLVEYLNQLSKVDLTPLEAPDPDLTYMFKHIITQEVAYNLMLFEQRRQLHQTIGEWFEKNHADDLPNYYPTLAYHWSKVAEDDEAQPAMIAKAIGYLFQAGEQAIGNYANVEASAHLKQALALLPRLPASTERDQQEIGMQAMLAYSLVTQRGYGDPEVEQAYTRAQELLARVPGSPQLAFVLYGMFSYYASRAEYAQATQIAERLLALGESLHDQPILAVGYQSQAIVAFCCGDLPNALAYAQKSYDLAEPLDSAAFFQFGGDFQAYTSSWLALAQVLSGYPDQAQHTFEHALAITEKQPYPHSFVLGFACIPQLKHDVAEVFKRTEELVGLSQKYSFVLLGLQGNIFRAWALATAQKEMMGVQILEGTTGVPKFVKLDSFVPWYLALLAEGESALGKHDAALQAIDEAIDYAERAGGNFYQAELFRVKGAIRQAQGAAAESIEPLYREAIQRAQNQKAKWWELRASVSLARWLTAQNKSGEARVVLQPIASWFTEGLSTADVIEAKTLLAELAKSMS